MKPEHEMENCLPPDPNIFRPQYKIVSVSYPDRCIFELGNVDTKQIFPVWQHPKLMLYANQIRDFGLFPKAWREDQGTIWVNWLNFGGEMFETEIDVFGAFKSSNSPTGGVRFPGILHLNEEWFCEYNIARELRMF